MKNKYFAVLLILVGVILRLLPHAPNVAPIGAVAIISGMYFSKRLALLVPLVILVVTDAVLGFHSTMGFVYASYALIGIMSYLNRKHISLSTVLRMSFIASTAFFIITNFGVWVTTSMYEKSWLGLWECYVMALPFFRNSLIGDLFYSLIFYIGFAVIFGRDRDICWFGISTHTKNSSLHF